MNNIKDNILNVFYAVFGAVFIWSFCWLGAIADYLINGVK